MSDEDRGDWEHDVAKDKELDRRWDEALTKAKGERIVELLEKGEE